MWPLVNCSREMPFLGLLFTLLIPLDSQIQFVFWGKRKIRKIMCMKNKISYCLAFENNTVEISGLLLFFYLYFSCVSLFFFPFIFISWRLKNILGTSLVVQWLRLCASKAGGPGSIPGQGTKSDVLQSCMLLRSPGAAPLAPQKEISEAGDSGETGLIPESGRSPGGGNGDSLQYPCRENRMDGGAWRATVHGNAKNQTRLSKWAQQQQLFTLCTLFSTLLLSLNVFCRLRGILMYSFHSLYNYFAADGVRLISYLLL